MTSVHQIIPVLAPYDAVGGHTRRVQRALRDRGFRSDIFAEVVLGDAPEGTHLLEQFDDAGAGADLLLYQASTGCAAADWLMSRPEALAVNHHNVTPAHFFDRWAPDAAENMRRARNQIRALAPRSVAGLADSAYNADELRAIGYRGVSVTPLLLDLAGPPVEPDERVATFLRERSGGAHLLFVGRLAPNKCQHDVLASFAAYRLLHDPEARLTLVGSPAAASYAAELLALADDLGVADAVTMTSGLTDAELSAYYADADVFVCLSEHEGFCIPLLEAMRHDTPVVAFAAAAIPDTLGDAGVLLPEKRPRFVAAAIAELLADAAWRSELAVAGQARVLEHLEDRTIPVFTDAIDGALRSAGVTVDG